jgi:hypothetical protein
VGQSGHAGDRPTGGQRSGPKGEPIEGDAVVKRPLRCPRRNLSQCTPPEPLAPPPLLSVTSWREFPGCGTGSSAGGWP